MQINEASHFPVISRTGRTSEELQQIIDCLNLSSTTGTAFSIMSVPAGKKYNSIQQRIRAQAKKLNYAVEIHFDKNKETLYFRVKASNPGIETPIISKKVVSKDIKGVKSKVNAK